MGEMTQGCGENHGNMITLPVNVPLDLEASFLCGQAFRWKKVEDWASYGCGPSVQDGAENGVSVSGKTARPVVSFKGVIGDAGVLLRLAGSHPAHLQVFFDPKSYGNRCLESKALEVSRYLALDDDLESIEAELVNEDPVMQKAFDFGRGLRILRQDPWECLASYILSSNNSVTNISRTVQYLSSRFGKPLGFGEYSFPTPEDILAQDPGVLSESKCGFRGPYLLDAAERVATGRFTLSSLGTIPISEAREHLLTIKGVGPKVCDCVLLFAYHRLEVFPVDVWVARAMSKLYFGGREISPKEARAEGERRFGPMAGYAQEYLFHYMRNSQYQSNWQ